MLKSNQHFVRNLTEEISKATGGFSIDPNEEPINFRSSSNEVALVTAKKEGYPHLQLIVKKLRKDHPEYLSIDEEALVVEEMSRKGFGPKCLGTDNKTYRIEEYINARRANQDDFKDYRVRRAHVLAISQFNSLNIEGFQRGITPDYENISQEKFEAFVKALPDLPDLPKLEGNSDIVDFLKGIIPRDEKVLCQGDQYLCNILINEETHKVTVIDYERTHYSFRGYDLGCYNMYLMIFFHWDTFKVNFVEENYPTEDTIREQAECYVVFCDMNMDEKANQEHIRNIISEEGALKKYIEECYQGQKRAEFDEKVKRIMKNIRIAFMGRALCSCMRTMERLPKTDDEKTQGYLAQIRSTWNCFLRAREDYRRLYLKNA